MTQTEMLPHLDQVQKTEERITACKEAILVLQEQLTGIEQRMIQMERPVQPAAPICPERLQEIEPEALKLPEGPEKTVFVEHPEERDLKRAGCWVTAEKLSIEEPSLREHAFSFSVLAALTVTVVAADAMINPGLTPAILNLIIACNALGVMILAARFIRRQWKYDQAVRQADEAALQKSVEQYMTKKKAAEHIAKQEYEQLCGQLKEMHENDEARYWHNVKENADRKEEYDRKTSEYPYILAMHQRSVTVFDDSCRIYEAMRLGIEKNMIRLQEIKSWLEEQRLTLNSGGALCAASCDIAAGESAEDAVQAMRRMVSNALCDIIECVKLAQNEISAQRQSVCDEYNRAVDPNECRSDDRYRELMTTNGRAEAYMAHAADKLRDIHEGVVTASMMQYLTMN